MKKFILGLVCILLSVSAILVTSSTVWAACSNCTTSSASCTAGTTVAQVNSCLSSLPDGGVIKFDPGSYNWSSSIVLNTAKGVSLMGNGAGSSVVTAGASNIIYMDNIIGTNNKKYRISGFTFQNLPAGKVLIWLYGLGNLTNLRIDHNTFSNLGTSSIAILLGSTGGYGKIYGVIDHNTFNGTNNFMGMKALGPTAWPPSPKGTANNIFVENNTFNFTYDNDLNSGCIDAWIGSSVVYRNNTSTNCLVTLHGVVHGGPASVEFYGNSLTANDVKSGWSNGTRLFHHQGSGELIAFSNTFTAMTPHNEPLDLTHYRSATAAAAGYSGYRCDGTNPNTGVWVDGNRSPIGTYYGYPCYHQPGRDKDGNLSPIYAWNNKWSDTSAKIDITIENPWNASNPSVATHLQANRDYYNAVSANAQTSSSTPFNGTVGMGFGTLANRPKSCTTNSLESGGGVGYWATDTSTLYRCSAADTWIVHYTPYTYPHPLTVPAPPENLHIIP